MKSRDLLSKKMKNWMQSFKKPRPAKLLGHEAFTLVEMLVVIALIGMLATVVGLNVLGKLEQAKVDTTKINIKNLSTILDSYRLDCGRYPTTDQGLEALQSKPATAPDCPKYDPEGYIRKGQALPKDGWDESFLYTSESPREFEIKSLGADKAAGGSEYDADISSQDKQSEGA